VQKAHRTHGLSSFFHSVTTVSFGCFKAKLKAAVESINVNYQSRVDSNSHTLMNVI